MELHYGIKQPLRFYENLEHQNRYRHGANDRVFELLCPVDYLLPFQIKRDAGVMPITSIEAISIVDGSTTNIMQWIEQGELGKFPFQNYDYLVHYGSQELQSNFTPGKYYLVVSDSINTWYSEVITFKNFESNLSTGCALTKITYWDTCDVANIFYRTSEYGGPQYKNIIYLDIDVGKPTYEFDEEGDEDGEGNFTPDYKRLGKQYQLQGVFPEYIVDALTLLPLHIGGSGVVEVLTQRGYTGEVDTISIDPKWQGDLGVWALTDILFATEFIVKTGCCDALDQIISTCLRNATPFVAELLEGSDDYNNFEYTDASNGTTKIPLVDGDKVLIEFLSGEKLLRQYNETAGTYDTFLQLFFEGAASVDSNKANGVVLASPYHFWGGSGAIGWLQEPTISFLGEDPVSGQYMVQGSAWAESLIEIRVNTGGFGSTIYGRGTGEQLMNGGILFDFPVPGNAQYMFIRAVGLTCNLGDSENENFPGIGFMEIENNFIVT